MTAAPRSGPHNTAEILTAGPAPQAAGSALILLHGRGGTASDILAFGQELHLHNVSLLAPQAGGNTWYPNSFLSPIESNEPWLTSALALIQNVVSQCISNGITADHIAVLGFSQGACLACEYVARHPRRYAALVAFTGGLLGPVGSDLHHSGSLDGTPVLLSSGDPDPHVPWKRVEETAEQFKSMGGRIQATRYAGRPHMILPKEVESARHLLRAQFTISQSC